MNQISRQRRQSITLKFGKAIFDSDVLPFCVSCFFQTSPERGKEAIREGIGDSNMEKSDCRDCGLLRACHERPSCPYTERRDELPPPHGSPSRPTTVPYHTARHRQAALRGSKFGQPTSATGQTRLVPQIRLTTRCP